MTTTVTVIWESRFGRERAEEGCEINQRIWTDMRTINGYLDHELLEDLDEPGHFFVVSRWISREAADRIRDQYASQSECDPRQRAGDGAPSALCGKDRHLVAAS